MSIMEIGLGITLTGMGIEDFMRKEISLWGILVESIFAAAVFWGQQDLDWNLLWGSGIGVIIMLISLVTKEKIGMGDGVVIGILGASLGGGVTFQILLLALFLSGLFALIMIWLGKYSWKSTLPFIPFLAAGYIGVLLC